MSKCNLPPEGWECSRDARHPGPCAASLVIWHGLKELQIQLKAKDAEIARLRTALEGIANEAKYHDDNYLEFSAEETLAIAREALNPNGEKK